MVSNREDGKYAIIAAICYALLVFVYILDDISFVQVSRYASIEFSDVFSWILFGGLAVTLFLRKEAAVLIAIGINTLDNIIDVIADYTLFSLTSFLAYAALGVLVILAIKKGQYVSKIWLVAGAVMLIGRFACWLIYDYFSMLSLAWEAIVYGLIEITGLFFAGMWIKEKASMEKNALENECVVSIPKKASATPPRPEMTKCVEEIRMYKELLDSGILTQEEFDAKKKQILGL